MGKAEMAMKTPSFIFAIARMIARKEIRYNVIIMGCCVLLTFSLGIPARKANRGLYKLTAKRIEIMKELRPVFVQYRQDNGTYPGALEDLAPKYLPEIPTELMHDGRDDPYKRISYTLEGGQPFFYFSTIRGPDSVAIYNMDEDTLWHDR